MIRDSLQAWKKVTEQLLIELDDHDENNRAHMVDQVKKILEIREQLQPSIQPPFTEEELVFGKGLLPLEEKLALKLKGQLRDIRLNISDQQRKKVSIHAYMDPYSQVNRDGTFYDKKK